MISTDHKVAELRQRFSEIFGAGDVHFYRAPGRVNLIGEHTDYNDGFVLPAAIDFYTYVALRRRPDRRLVIYSTNFEQSAEFDLERMQALGQNHWSNYAAGVAAILLQQGHALSGADLLVEGGVPIGSGLSSSAAIEVSVGYALLDSIGERVEPPRLALSCQRAENEFVGMRCGIMDQFISCCGQEGHALRLDCRSLDYELVPIPQEVALVICNTMVKHQLASGEYNERRAACETGARLLGVKALRDATPAMLEERREALGDVVYRRCRHVVSEDQRVLDMVVALRNGDLARCGELMAASHQSLREDYEVSCPELDLMVELARTAPGVHGARMTGGGFGGCTVNLVGRSQVESFVAHVRPAYEQQTGHRPDIYVCNASAGASRLD